MLLSSISKKLTALFLALAVAALNKKMGLNLTPDEVITFIIAALGYICAQAHVDGKKAAAVNTVINTLQAAAVSPIAADPNLTYKDLVKTVNTVHTAITEVLTDLQKNDGSQAFHDAANAYTILLGVVQDFKKPEPLPAIPEQKVSA